MEISIHEAVRASTVRVCIVLDLSEISIHEAVRASTKLLCIIINRYKISIHEAVRASTHMYNLYVVGGRFQSTKP